jgi:uncharacterized protein (DUF924 family)
MSSISTIDPEINRTLSYWFDGPETVKKWFRGGPKVDAEIKDQFAELVEKARASQLTTWTEQPQGSLALLLLLDQFPRNIFRGTPLSFSSDSMAVEVATKAIAKGFDREVPSIQQPFFYMPLMHDECLLSQVAAVAIFEAATSRCEPNSDGMGFLQQSTQIAKLHRDIILKFGRYPSRNKALGRTSTPDEMQYLEEHPDGF